MELRHHTKARRKDKILLVGSIYTSAHYYPAREGIPQDQLFIRFQNDDGDLRYSARFTVREAEKLVQDFAQYIAKAKDVAP